MRGRSLVARALAAALVALTFGLVAGPSAQALDPLPPLPPPPFTLAWSASSASVAQGGTLATTVHVLSDGVFTGTVQLISPPTPQPQGVSVQLPSQPVAAGSSASVPINVSPTAPTGTVTVGIEGVWGDVRQQATLSITITGGQVVQPPPPAAPPQFTQVVSSSFPGTPFVTCLQGQFESGAHSWWLRPNASGALTVSVSAVSVNALESGSITGTLFDGPTALDGVTVAMPASGQTTLSFAEPVTAGTLYRLDVTRGTVPPPGQEGHHYTLGFDGVDVTVGISSPTFQSFEHGLQIVKVNAVAGEAVSLRFDSATVPASVSSGSVVVQAPGGTTVASIPTTPFTTTVGFTAPVTGTYAVTVDAHEHWTMEKVGGADTGVYAETCPPPAPPDTDQDGVPDAGDSCVDVPNADQANRDGDALGDVCDPDNDNDGHDDGVDNCPIAPNPSQSDLDGDGRGDACDASYAAGRMTGGGSVLSSTYGRVTHGFTVWCDPSAGSNNLQVNWGRGLAFHLEAVEAAYCGDVPGVGPEQPAAGFDVYSGRGSGRLNDGSPATVTWRLLDAGEPGRNDTFTVAVRDADGALILQASGNLDRGNHQAHG